MKNTTSIIALLLLCPHASLAQQPGPDQPMSRQHRLMPVPASVRFQAGRLKVDASFRVAVDGHTDARLQAAIHRAARRLEGRTGIEFSRAPASDARSATLLVECRGPGKGVPSID